MRSLSYRSKRRLKKTARTLLILAAFLVLFVILAVIYLGRYVVYTPDGAYLDFGRNTALQTATVGTEPSGPEPIESEMKLVISRWSVILEEYHSCTERYILTCLIHSDYFISLNIKG